VFRGEGWTNIHEGPIRAEWSVVVDWCH